MKKGKIKRYSIYPGCLIPSRYPSIEIASRKVLADLGVELFELKGTTCCPNQMAIKSTDTHLWSLLSARNLAIAEKAGYDILTLCNGCYNSLKTMNTALTTDDKLRTKLNKDLSSYGLEFKGNINVKHILEVLHDDLGPMTIERSVVRPLKGLRGALHYGCHIIRPEDNITFDDLEKPKTLDKLVEILGIKSVDYPDKHLCCGGGLKIASAEDAASFARKKLMHIKEYNANCLIVVCPYCRAQFESAKAEIAENYNEKFDLPIFYYTELLALAMGYSPEDLGLYLHEKNPVEKRDLLGMALGKVALGDIFDHSVPEEQIDICLDCQACVDDCSAAMVSDYHPEELMALAKEGKVDELLKRKDIWYCMNCHECINHCPQGFGMVKFIFRLKNLATQHGICPEVIANRDKALSSTGYAFEADNALRKKLGLPPIKGSAPKDLSKLITGTTLEKVIKKCNCED